jgi:hypothetical protein
MTTIEALLMGRPSGVAMRHDVKELVGILMRVLDNAEITEAEVLDLEFDADGELMAALNEAYIALLEFVHDRDIRMADRDLDRRERSALQDLLNKIVKLRHG